MKIIESLLEEVKDIDSTFEKIRQICNKMKSENDYKNDVLESSEILYYYKYDDNDFFERYLTLSFDSLDIDSNKYLIDKWEFKKLKNEEDDPVYKRKSSFTSKRINNPEEILLIFAKILKKLIGGVNE